MVQKEPLSSACGSLAVSHHCTPVQTRPCQGYQSHRNATAKRGRKEVYGSESMRKKEEKRKSRIQRAQRGVVYLTALAMALPLRAEEWSRESLQPRLTRVCFTDVLLIHESLVEHEQMFPLSTLAENDLSDCIRCVYELPAERHRPEFQPDRPLHDAAG